MSEIAKKHATISLNRIILKMTGALAAVIVALFAFYVLPMSGWSHLLIFVAGIGFCYAWIAPTNKKEN